MLERGADLQPTVRRLHFVFADWLGDDLMTSHPVYLVTVPLATALEQSDLTGFSLSDDFEVSVDHVWQQLNAERVPPPVLWLQVEGAAGEADLGLAPDRGLVASERALHVLQLHRVELCDVTPFAS